MEQLDSGVIAGVIGGVVAIFIAWYRTRATSSANLLKEYREELLRIRAELTDVKSELDKLQKIINSNYGTLRAEYELLMDELKREVRVVTEKYTTALRENAELREKAKEFEMRMYNGTPKK